MVKDKVTVTSSTKQAYNSAMLGARTLKGSRDVSSDQKMTLKAKVIVKFTMTFRTLSLIAVLCGGGWVVQRCHVSYVTRASN